MTYLLLFLFVAGLVLKLGVFKKLNLVVSQMAFWRDIFLLTLLTIPLMFNYKGTELAFIALPMAIYFLRFDTKALLEEEIYLVILFISFPITYLLNWNQVLPTLAASFFPLVYGYKKSLTRGIVPSLIIASFWFFNFKFGGNEVFKILAPLVLLVAYRESQMSEKHKPLEYSYLLIGIALAYEMIGIPLWLKTAFLSALLPVILLADTTFIKRIIWITILLPLAYSGEGFKYFQVTIPFIAPIVLTILNMVKEELKSFKVSSSNEVVMTYRQIGVFISLILTLGGFQGTLLTHSFPESPTFALILMLVFGLFLAPLKEVLTKNLKRIDTRNEEVYFLVRTIIFFVVIALSGGLLAKGYSFYSLGFLVLILGIAACFRGIPVFESILKKYFTKIRFSFGLTEKGIFKFRGPSYRNTIKASEGFQGWYGYNSSIEISLVFLALFLLVYLEGL